jgi:hypothetical protein
MNSVFEKLAAFQNQGGPMHPRALTGCVWLRSYNDKEEENPNPYPLLSNSPEGWPLHPRLEISFQPKGDATLNFTWKNEKGEVVAKTDFTMGCLLTWPGSAPIISLARFLTARDDKFSPPASVRMMSFRLCQEMTKKHLGEKVFAAIQKRKGTQRMGTAHFLTHNLDERPEVRQTQLDRRLQALESFPELAWGSQCLHRWKDNHGGFEMMAAMGESDKPWIAPESIIAAIDEGKPLEETLHEMAGPPWETMGLKNYRHWAKLHQGSITLTHSNSEFFSERMKAIGDILQDTPPEYQEEIRAKLRKSTQRVSDLITALGKTKSAKLSRLRAHQDLGHLYQNPPTMPPNPHIGEAFLARKNARPDIKHILRMDMILMHLLEWDAKAKGKVLHHKLIREELKKPFAERHAIHIPDTRHIADYLLANYPDNIPLHLAPEKLLENIRKWDLSLLETKTPEKEERIPDLLLKHYPPLESKRFLARILETNLEFHQESKEMRHCVQGYFNRAKQGGIAIYSLTDQMLERWTAEVSSDGKLLQLRGINNRAPSEGLRKDVAESIKKAFKAKGKKDPSIPLPEKSNATDKIWQKLGDAQVFHVVNLEGIKHGRIHRTQSVPDWMVAKVEADPKKYKVLLPAHDSPFQNQEACLAFIENKTIRVENEDGSKSALNLVSQGNSKAAIVHLPDEKIWVGCLDVSPSKKSILFSEQLGLKIESKRVWSPIVRQPLTYRQNPSEIIERLRSKLVEITPQVEDALRKILVSKEVYRNKFAKKETALELVDPPKTKDDLKGVVTTKEELDWTPLPIKSLKEEAALWERAQAEGKALIRRIRNQVDRPLLKETLQQSDNTNLREELFRHQVINVQTGQAIVKTLHQKHREDRVEIALPIPEPYRGKEALPYQWVELHQHLEISRDLPPEPAKKSQVANYGALQRIRPLEVEF